MSTAPHASEASPSHAPSPGAATSGAPTSPAPTAGSATPEAPTPEAPTPGASTPADVLIVGAGVAGTSALLELLAAHREGRTGRAELRIDVLERSEDLFAGLPYGARSGSASLIVTPLRDFLPGDLRADFVAWLRARREAVLTDGAELGISGSWVADHAEAIRADGWEDLHLPRRLFGRFLGERTRAAIDATPGAVVRTRRGEALDLHREGSRTVVRVRTAEGEERRAARAVLLATGSPPKQTLPHGGDVAPGTRPAVHGRFVQDTHTGSMDDLIARLRRDLAALPAGAGRDVLVVGAGADALELLHAAHRLEPGLDPGRRIHVLAPRGTPDAWTARPDRSTEFRSTHLRALVEDTSAPPTAAGLHDAVAQDVAAAIAEGLSEQDTVPELKRLEGELLDRLPPAEMRAYVTTYGNLVNRFSRPTGSDYQQVATSLLADGRVRVLPGSFLRAEDGPAGWTVHARTPSGTEELPGTYGVIVNCAGFQTLSATDDPLLRALLDAGTVRATESDRGLEVDERFRAAPGVLVAGPLLAGNLNSRVRVWHLESCRRILAMAPEVAAAVVAELEGDDGA